MNRDQFEAWVLGREHKHYGWLDKQALTRSDDSEGYVNEYINGCWTVMQMQPQSDVQPLSVWYGAMPESNGKTNWTGILHRKGECLSEGITIERSEYPERVRYECDRMRYLIGEIDQEPFILDYDADKHSGYVRPDQEKSDAQLEIERLRTLLAERNDDADRYRFLVENSALLSYDVIIEGASFHRLTDEIDTVRGTRTSAEAPQ